MQQSFDHQLFLEINIVMDSLHIISHDVRPSGIYLDEKVLFLFLRGSTVIVSTSSTLCIRRKNC